MNHRAPILLTIALAAAPVFAKEASIPFATLGGIQDWKADGSKALYVEGRNKKWYRAELMGACAELPFAERIGFVVEPTGDFDRFSAIVVRGRQCKLRSLAESTAPPAKSHT